MSDSKKVVLQRAAWLKAIRQAVVIHTVGEQGLLDPSHPLALDPEETVHNRRFRRTWEPVEGVAQFHAQWRRGCRKFVQELADKQLAASRRGRKNRINAYDTEAAYESVVGGQDSTHDD